MSSPRTGHPWPAARRPLLHLAVVLALAAVAVVGGAAIGRLVGHTTGGGRPTW